ncbi:MAG: hypothetical protein AAF937_00905 [Planctomycetota bacterium]
MSDFLTKTTSIEITPLISQLRNLRDDAFPRARELGGTGQLSVYVNELTAEFDNGGVVCGVIEARWVDEFAWCLRGDALREDFIGHALSGVASQAVFSSLVPSETLRIPIETCLGLELGAVMASRLYVGGAYTREGSRRQERDLQLGNDAARELLGGRFDDALIATSSVAWSPWFKDIAWDFSVFVFDRQSAELRFLCATDED